MRESCVKLKAAIHRSVSDILKGAHGRQVVRGSKIGVKLLFNVSIILRANSSLYHRGYQARRGAKFLRSSFATRGQLP